MRCRVTMRRHRPNRTPNNRLDHSIVYDPGHQLGKKTVNVFDLRNGTYEERAESSVYWFAEVSLGVRLWHGIFEAIEDEWLRWCDIDGELIATGEELAEQQRLRADYEHKRANATEERLEQAETRMTEEQQRAERYAARLRALGIDPDE